MDAKNIFRYLAQAALYLPFMVLIGYFSSQPAFEQLGGNEALIRLSLTHAAQRVAECRQRTPEELAKLPPNMRAPLDCKRERALPVTAGRHRIVARLRDSADGEFNYVREAELELKPGRVLVIDFHAGRGGFEFLL